MTFASRHLCLIGLLLIASLAAPPASAEPPKRGGPPILALRYAERLGLDADTQAKLREIVSESRARNRGLEEKLHAARDELVAQLESTAPDEAAVMAHADAASAIEGEIYRNRLQAILDIRKLLTPEQREELVRLASERPGRDGRHRSPNHLRGLGSCRKDQREHCPEATDGPALLSCLQENWSSLSEECRTAFDLSKPGKPPRHPGPPFGQPPP